jgi:hypothetical protein
MSAQHALSYVFIEYFGPIRTDPEKQLVPRRGLEPPRPKGHYDLNVARLPIPPSGHEKGMGRIAGKTR